MYLGGHLNQPNTKRKAPYLIPQTGRRVCHLGGPNLYKSCVLCPCTYLQVLSLPITILHHTIYYLRYPLGRFAGLKHRQLARQVGVIITTRRIRRTLSSPKSIYSTTSKSSRNAKQVADFFRKTASVSVLYSHVGKTRSTMSCV
jgi:hypothetical protein